MGSSEKRHSRVAPRTCQSTIPCRVGEMRGRRRAMAIKARQIARRLFFDDAKIFGRRRGKRVDDDADRSAAVGLVKRTASVQLQSRAGKEPRRVSRTRRKRWRLLLRDKRRTTIFDGRLRKKLRRVEVLFRAVTLMSVGGDSWRRGMRLPWTPLTLPFRCCPPIACEAASAEPTMRPTARWPEKCRRQKSRFPTVGKNPSHDQLIRWLAAARKWPPNRRRQVTKALRRLRKARENADYRPGITVIKADAVKLVKEAALILRVLEVRHENVAEN